jgi:hypothetical protein
MHIHAAVCTAHGIPHTRIFIGGAAIRTTKILYHFLLLQVVVYGIEGYFTPRIEYFTLSGNKVG